MKTIKYTDLLPGDVLLHASKGEVSKLIQWASNSDYSHIALVFKPGELAEAISSGVHFDDNLVDRLKGIPEKFHRIDAWRSIGAGDPISDAALAALRTSAQQMAGRPFALSQWFELGLICAVRNKAPQNPFCKWLIAKAINELVKVDPSRLLCSEFVYLSFFNAVTQPADVLKPKLTRPPRKNRPFPKDLDVWELIREYLDAKQKGSGSAAVIAILSDFASVSSQDIDAEWMTGQAAVLQLARAQWSTLFVSSGVSPHPDLIEPQDFAECPASFRELGSVTL